jgi:hypothetical protein
MNKNILDSKIIVYRNNTIENQISTLTDISNTISEENVWSISSSSNIYNTDLTLNSEILYLKNTDFSLNYLKRNIKHYLNSFSLPFILNYLDHLELSKQTIKTWTIAKNLQNLNFHHDKAKGDIDHEFTIIVFLNEDYEGGGVQFKDRVGNETITFKEGDVLIYPSNDQYLHKALPVTSGTQYAAISYF